MMSKEVLDKETNTEFHGKESSKDTRKETHDLHNK